MKKQAKLSTKPPFKECPSAKNLLSQWVLEEISHFFPDPKKETLLRESIEYILSDSQYKEIKAAEFDPDILEQMLHQTAG